MNPEQPHPESGWTDEMRRHLYEHPRADVLVEAGCAWCGLVTIEVGELSCAASDIDMRGLCQFVCPFCDRLSTTSVSLLEIKTLLLAGARLAARSPLELLEPKKGAPLSWDDVLDFSLAFEIAPQES